MKIIIVIIFMLRVVVANYSDYKKCQYNISQIDNEISDLEKLMDNSYKE